MRHPDSSIDNKIAYLGNTVETTVSSVSARNFLEHQSVRKDKQILYK